jgi:sugar phosphate isomerase/epimerase
MKDILSLQMFALQNAARINMFQTLQDVADMGYGGVEFAGFGDIPAKVLKQHLKDCGLVVTGCHTQIAWLERIFDDVLRYNVELGNPNVTLPRNIYKCKEDYYRFAEQYNKFGKRFKEYGIQFGYHSHDFEFQTFDGVTGLEILVKNTDPEYFKLELDTCFIKVAGLDPAETILKYADRSHLLHLKDRKAGDTRGNTEVGNGELDVKGILQAVKKTNIEYVVIEQEGYNHTPHESVKICFDNVKRILNEI